MVKAMQGNHEVKVRMWNLCHRILMLCEYAKSQE